MTKQNLEVTGKADRENSTGARHFSAAGISTPESKNPVVAGLLAIFVGGLGIHKFYLGRLGWGLIYLLFCWTGIPAVVGFIEGIIYLCQSQANFAKKYQ